MNKQTAIIAAATLVAFTASAAQRAAQTFDGVKMASIWPAPASMMRNVELTAPAPHVVTLEWYQEGNVLRHVIEESSDPRGPWEIVAVRWNDFIYANTTFSTSFVSNRNPAFWRVAASNTR